MPKLSGRFLLLLTICAVAGTNAPAVQAQEQEKTFDLSRPGSPLQTQKDEEATARHEPQIRAGQLQASFSVGYMDLATTLLAHEQIIYKITAERIYWGDLTLLGESAFNPILRLSYNLTPWFALESQFNFSVSEYQAAIVNAWSRETTQDPKPPVPVQSLGEFDLEQRSVLTYGGGLSAILYPLNLAHSRVSRFHPYLIGSYDRLWFDLNSRYTRGSSAEWVYGGGGGIRFIADEMISVRLEAVYRTTELQLMPTTNFEVLNEGTLPIPLYQFDGGVPSQVESFGSNSISGLSWSLGFVANF